MNTALGIPSRSRPNQGMLPETVYQMIHDELSLDSNPTLNLASFVTTWMDPYAERLYAKTYNKNLKQAVSYLNSLDHPIPHDSNCDVSLHH